MYPVLFKTKALEDLGYWVSIKPKMALKILNLIENISKEPFTGIGKPEPLKGSLSGCWSRRIDHEHRLVYKIESEILMILACRYHYES